MASLHNVDHDRNAMIIKKSTGVVERKPLKQLKDYLLDDLSSCSSNGFKSFPRQRHCCTTVRFLLELDLQQKDRLRPHENYRGRDRKRVLLKSRSRTTASATISALQRASDAVINAVRHLPFVSVRSPCRRLLRSRFWGKPDGRPRLVLSQVVEERCGPSDQKSLGASSGDNKSKRTISWCESESSSSSASTENDVVESAKDVSLIKKVNKKVDISVDEDSTQGTTTIKEWSNEEEKEQFSPVSVLDCPFEDDDHDDRTSSPNFHHKVSCLEGTKQKIIQKIRRFEKIAHLEPVDLEKRITKSELEDKLVTLSVRKDDINYDKGNKSEEKARELVKMIKCESGCLVFKADNLMFDFLKERVMEENNLNKVINEKEALKVMKDWVNGEIREVFLGWEVREARKVYLKDMEKGGKWVKLDCEKEDIGLDLEAKIWDSLVHEVLLDLL